MKDLFDKIIYRSIKNNATDVHLEMTNVLSIRLRIKNELIDYDKLNYSDGIKLLNYIKYQAGINTNKNFTPQTGMINYDLNTVYHLRVSYIPKTEGESIVIRILNNHKNIDIHNISKIKEVYDFYLKIKDYDQGLVVISGPTGSGKSTTLYTLMDYINNTTSKKIISIEDPIEVKKDYATQIELNEELGLDYQSILKQILRHDPDVIIIGEIRDEKVAKIAITCALTGHLVLTTIHSSSAILTIKRLLNLGIDTLDLEDVLTASISQRIKYIDNQIFIISEIIQKTQILDYLNYKTIQYNTMKDNEELLMKKYNLDQSILMES